jgi:hypothetical protein
MALVLSCCKMDFSELPFTSDESETREIQIHDVALTIGESGYHPLNAGKVWKGTIEFAEWVTDNR